MAAEVNGRPITEAEVVARVRQREQALAADLTLSDEERAAALAVAPAQSLDALIDEQLIQQGAAERGITINDGQVEQALTEERDRQGGEAAFEAWLTSKGLTPEEYREEVRFQLLLAALSEALSAEVPAQQEQRHLLHILSLSETEAAEVSAAIAAGGDFRTVAQERSRDPGSRAAGGDLGFLPRGLLEPALEVAAWSLAPGQTSAVITSTFGFHHLQVVAVEPDRPLALPHLQALQAQAFDRWLQAAREAATIERELLP